VTKWRFLCSQCISLCQKLMRLFFYICYNYSVTVCAIISVLYAVMSWLYATRAGACSRDCEWRRRLRPTSTNHLQPRCCRRLCSWSSQVCLRSTCFVSILVVNCICKFVNAIWRVISVWAPFQKRMVGLPPTHEPYLPLLPCRNASPPFDYTHCAYPPRNGLAELTWVASHIPR